MATGGFDAEAAPNSNSDPSNINLLPAQNGLDNGGHLSCKILSGVSVWLQGDNSESHCYSQFPPLRLWAAAG
jgi:hypothetical protein